MFDEMSFSLTQFSWWHWGNGKDQEAIISSDSMKLSSSKKKETKLSSSRKVKKKWHSREERKRVVDKEYDVVLVPSDGVCLSASDESSYDSDWSIGWMEPHAPDFFQSDDEGYDAASAADDDDADNSFAVLVPCYRNDYKGFKIHEMEEQPSNQLLNVLTTLPNGFPADGNKYMEQWLASLQNF